MSENPTSTGARIGWITLAGLVAVAAFFVGRVDRAIERASTLSAQESQQDARITGVESWRIERNAAEVQMIGRQDRLERKVDTLIVWLRIVGRSNGWPDFPSPERDP